MPADRPAHAARVLKYPDRLRQLASSAYPLAAYRRARREGKPPFAQEDPGLELPLPAGVGQRPGKDPGEWPWSVYVRVLPPVGGWMSADLLEDLADLVDRYGMGLLHFATGGTLEIYTTAEQVLPLTRELNRRGLDVGSTGEGLRCLVACPGPARCEEAVVDAPALATYLGRRFLEEQQYPGLPRKCKAGVAGCPHDCVRASHRDLAFLGVRDPERGVGLAWLVGGKYGLRTRGGAMPGRVLLPFVPLEESDYRLVGDLCQRFLALWSRLARDRERVGDFVARWGPDRILAEMGWRANGRSG